MPYDWTPKFPILLLLPLLLLLQFVPSGIIHIRASLLAAIAGGSEIYRREGF